MFVWSFLSYIVLMKWRRHLEHSHFFTKFSEINFYTACLKGNPDIVSTLMGHKLNRLSNRVTTHCVHNI